jgi:hypothetical protein
MLSECPLTPEAHSIWNYHGMLRTKMPWRTAVTQSTMEDPMNSRVFVVCGKSVEVRSVTDTMHEAPAAAVQLHNTSDCVLHAIGCRWLYCRRRS